MALCESHLDSTIPLQPEESSPSSPRSEESQESPSKAPNVNGDDFAEGPPGLPLAGALPLTVDYRSPVSHFVPPAVELYTRQMNTPVIAPQSSQSATPAKRKRGRPRVDKTSPEYLANLAARKQAKEMEAMMNTQNTETPSSGEKRKRGRPRIDKTSPEYLARKRQRELEALEKKAKREYRRRTTGDSAASSSAGEGTPRVKRKYTKRTPSAKTNDTPGVEKVKGKRGRPRKADLLARQGQTPGAIRVRSNLMPANSDTINLDSDEEPGLGSPSQTSDSLSLDENLRALRHIHEKYANIDKDDMYEAHLLAANFKKPLQDHRLKDDDEVLSIRSSEGTASVKETDRVEKLEDSSNSDSDSSSSGSSSSGSSSSSSGSDSSSSSDSSDSESDTEKPKTDGNTAPNTNGPDDDSRSFGAWSYSNPQSDSDSDPERLGEPTPPADLDEISESENESSDKSFQCHICRKWYSTRVTLKIHRRGHQNRGNGTSRSRTRSSDRYECDCCSETFNRREKLWEHRAQAHRGAMTVRCEVCRKCFEDETELAAHDRMHTFDEREGRCSDCGLTFNRFDQLRRHRACAHGAASAAAGSNLPHACQQCGKRFGHAHSLTRHMQNHAKQLYRCVVCKASFARADQLAQHLNSHLANYKRLKP